MYVFGRKQYGLDYNHAVLSRGYVHNGQSSRLVHCKTDFTLMKNVVVS